MKPCNERLPQPTELSEAIGEAIDFGRHPLDECVKIVGGDGSVKVDGWLDHKDIKRAAKSIEEFEQRVKEREEMETKNEWYEKGELPPIDSLVDVCGNNLVYGRDEKECRVRGYIDGVVVVQMSYGYGCFLPENLKPSKTEEDELMEQANSLFERTKCTLGARQGIEHAVEVMIKAGWRPTTKKDD